MKMFNKLTKEIINNERLQNRTVKMIGDYCGITKYNTFKCDICNHLWITIANCVINNGTNCPKCAGNIKLTKEIVNKRIKDRNIIMLGDYETARILKDFQCGNCKYIWKVSPDQIMNAGTGCPKCAGTFKLTNEDLDLFLLPLNIKRLDDYVNKSTPIRFQCILKNCMYIWKTAPNNIRQGAGCHKCNNHLRLTKEIINEKLKDRNIIIIGDVINNETKTHFQCQNNGCYNIWSAKPANILFGKGCPLCNKPGNTQKLIWNILNDFNILYEKDYFIKNINKNIIKRFTVDSFLKNYNLIIEYNGIQHYKPIRFGGISQELAELNFIKQQKRDQYIDQFCNDNNIKLIWIDGRIYKKENLKEYVLQILKDNNII